MSNAVGIEMKAIPLTMSVNEDTKVAEALSQVQADTFTLYLKTHNFRWNVIGPKCHTLHLMFEEQYNELWRGRRCDCGTNPSPGLQCARFVPRVLQAHLPPRARGCTE
jgi:hypothetical protein